MTATAIAGDRLLPVREVIDRLGGISQRRLYHEFESGNLERVHIGRRIFVRESELIRFMDSLGGAE